MEMHRGWKPVEREIAHPLPLDTAVECAQQRGFGVQRRHDGYALLRRQGTQLALSGVRLPLELALVQGGSGLFVQLRYDTFVAFDTGDLDQMADELAQALHDAADRNEG